MGNRFIVSMNPKRLTSTEGWWTWGSLESDLGGNKFAKWERPDMNGEIENLMPGKEMPDVAEMEKDGWLSSEPFDELKVGNCEGTEVIVEFVQ